jgi:drug/metabolite transporter (DMT)-like permease
VWLVAGLTLVALFAFAANSLLARAAIGPGADGARAIGPVAFTAVRLAAGALVLLPWWRTRPGRPARARAWLGPLLLAAYALPFALAYVALGAAVGALLLFGAVQSTMLLAGRRAGERLGRRGAVGLTAAATGLAVLLAPGVEAPPLLAALVMLLAGVAWGAYSLAGRGAPDPVRATARNFAGALPVAVVLAAWPGAWTDVRLPGVLLAVVSGALTSGLGYVVWYVALPHLTRMSAAVVQLAVPVVAALGAVAFLGELLSARLVVATALVLGGVAAVVLRREPAARPSQRS